MMDSATSSSPSSPSSPSNDFAALDSKVSHKAQPAQRALYVQPSGAVKDALDPRFMSKDEIKQICWRMCDEFSADLDDLMTSPYSDTIRNTGHFYSLDQVAVGIKVFREATKSCEHEPSDWLLRDTLFDHFCLIKDVLADVRTALAAVSAGGRPDAVEELQDAVQDLVWGASTVTDFYDTILDGPSPRTWPEHLETSYQQELMQRDGLEQQHDRWRWACMPRADGAPVSVSSASQTAKPSPRVELPRQSSTPRRSGQAATDMTQRHRPDTRQVSLLGGVARKETSRSASRNDNAVAKGGSLSTSPSQVHGNPPASWAATAASTDTQKVSGFLVSCAEHPEVQADSCKSQFWQAECVWLKLPGSDQHYPMVIEGMRKISGTNDLEYLLKTPQGKIYNRGRYVSQNDLSRR